MADWVEQAFEWAQRISNGESWKTICNDADTAKLINADAVGNLAAAMNSVGGLLVHVSTD